jgi:hypothetical protein
MPSFALAARIRSGSGAAPLAHVQAEDNLDAAPESGGRQTRDDRVIGFCPFAADLPRALSVVIVEHDPI